MLWFLQKTKLKETNWALLAKIFADSVIKYKNHSAAAVYVAYAAADAAAYADDAAAAAAAYAAYAATAATAYAAEKQFQCNEIRKLYPII